MISMFFEYVLPILLVCSIYLLLFIVREHWKDTDYDETYPPIKEEEHVCYLCNVHTMTTTGISTWTDGSLNNIYLCKQHMEGITKK